MSDLLSLLYVGLTVEDLNLTENFSQANRMGEGKSDFTGLDSVSAACSKVNSICYGKGNKEKGQSFQFCPLSHFGHFLKVK